MSYLQGYQGEAPLAITYHHALFHTFQLSLLGTLPHLHDLFGLQDLEYSNVRAINDRPNLLHSTQIQRDYLLNLSDPAH